MTYSEFRTRLLSLSPESNCLRFIADRIKQDDYRGVHISQHNRYDYESACDILYEFKVVAKNGQIKIRTTDLSKHPDNMEGTEKYCQFCATLFEKHGKYTQDTIRKNFFVDFARMGLINRFDKNGELIPLTKRTCCQYISLTARGKILANKTTTRKDKYIAFSKGLDMMSNSLALTLFNLSANTEGKITRMEYTYFVSFLGQALIKRQGNRTKRIIISEQVVIDLINEYRSLRNIHADIDKVVREYCKPGNFTGDKTNKRDFSNWINETDQTFKLLSTTVYFELLSKYNTLKLRVDSRMGIDNMQGLQRSAQEKENYFLNHRVERGPDKTLHHIVPIDTWIDLDDFKLLDDWRNMIYIDKGEHDSLHDLHPIPYHIIISNNSFSLSDNEETMVSFENGNSVWYSHANSNIMIDYNRDLIASRNG